VTAIGNDRQKKHWDAVADGWAAWAEWTDRNFAPLADWFAHAAGWRAGARVLDVACGAGFPALAAASHVGPAGTVVAIDLSPAMREVVSRRAREAGAGNVEVLEMDAEDLRFDDGSFDAVTNAYGLMFCANPQRALAEAFRVLTPHGRCAVAVWAEPAASPFFSLIGAAAAKHLSLPLPDAGAPGPFRFADARTLESLMRDAGFAHVSVERLALTLDCGPPESYCRMFHDVAWKSRMAAASDAEHARFRDAVAAAVAPSLDAGRVRLVATSLCACGSR